MHQTYFGFSIFAEQSKKKIIRYILDKWALETENIYDVIVNGERFDAIQIHSEYRYSILN